MSKEIDNSLREKVDCPNCGVTQYFNAQGISEDAKHIFARCHDSFTDGPTHGPGASKLIKGCQKVFVIKYKIHLTAESFKLTP